MNTLIEETQPVIEHTIKTIRGIFDDRFINIGKKVEIDDESFVDICGHLALVYHLLVIATAESLIHKKQDINTNTANILCAIEKLLGDCFGEITKESTAEAIDFVDSIFSKVKGNA